MSKLFILGNGFDLSLGLPTKYLHFKRWLENNYTFSQPVSLPECSMGHHGEAIYDENEIVGFLYDLIESSLSYDDSEWNEFEFALGNLDFGHVFGEISPFYKYYDRHGDENPFATTNNREEIAGNVEYACNQLGDYFGNWIGSVDITKAKDNSKITSLFEKESKFLTFNYTKTLEDKFSIDCGNVCHIHGNLDEKIIVGHGLSDSRLEELQKEFEIRYFGADYIFSNILERFKKDVVSQIVTNKAFFSSLENIDKVYSCGFSYNEIDLPYMLHLCKCLDTKNITWYIDNYDEANFEKIKLALIKCGFKGQFDLF